MGTIKVDTTGDTGTISVSGAFDFNRSREFREACMRLIAARDVRRIRVDLREADYIDSSALGMLLLLREEAGTSNRTLQLTHCGETVRQIFQVAHFDTLFDIS